MKPFRDDRAEFADECADRARRMSDDAAFRALSLRWQEAAIPHRYSYNFRWLGLPILQYPEDIVALQEIVWGSRPDLIVETGVARGGSSIFYASLLELLGRGRVISIDIDIRPHNREAIESHPLARHVELLDGSSVDPEVVSHVARAVEAAERVMVVLDSNHTHAHVLEEMRIYGPLVSPGCHLVVLDTLIESLPPESFPDRPWDLGDNSATAVAAYLAETERFLVDTDIEDKLPLSAAPGGYLRARAA